MIEYTSGDILRADVDAIVNTVNCVGVMGRGIALQFKKAWPGNFTAYASACKEGKVKPGRLFVFETGQMTNPRIIVNFPTKRHWRSSSRIEDIESGLQDLIRVIEERNITTIAIPPLGSGLGGLEWPEVRAKIEEALADIERTYILVFEPKGAPTTDRMVKNRKPQAMTPGRAVLIELIQRYLAGLLDPSISLLEVHKLLYFMQELGEPLKLRYRHAHYGPYAENLRHVLNSVEGQYISGYADGGDQPYKALDLIPGAVEEARQFLAKYPETIARFSKVSDLVAGFESPAGLELLATVHWLLKHENIAVDNLSDAIHNWSERKRRFSEKQINIAKDILSRKDWLAA